MAIDKALQNKLLKMVRDDQRARKLGYQDLKTDNLNTKKLKTIIKHYSWPTLSLVGQKGAEAAWLVAQHADFDVRFQKQCLKLIQNAAKSGEAPKHHIAYLVDRILVHEKKKQIFGTQFYKKSGDNVFLPWPIKDAKYLDKRRREYNLPPFKMYKKLFLKSNTIRNKN